MPQPKDQITGALNSAIRLEKEGIKTYLDYARATEDITGKNMFILLARDEVDHMLILEEQLQNFTSCARWKEMSVKPSTIKKILPKLKDVDNLPRGISGINQVEALEMALESEERARRLYSSLADQIEDKTAKALFLYLADMERAHWDILNAQKNSIQETELWVEIADLNMDQLMS
ncbi:MAG: ferritin family protein [Vulcanimicrobiota bacterium]